MRWSQSGCTRCGGATLVRSGRATLVQCGARCECHACGSGDCAHEETHMRTVSCGSVDCAHD
eukprot:82641-Chlamydomonas_euryale.AAC.1